jgi:hypothetical protein
MTLRPHQLTALRAERGPVVMPGEAFWAPTAQVEAKCHEHAERAEQQPGHCSAGRGVARCGHECAGNCGQQRQHCPCGDDNGDGAHCRGSCRTSTPVVNRRAT